MLVAYDADGNVIGHLDHMVARGPDGSVAGLIDFAAHEAAGGDHTDIWLVDTHDPAHPVKGSKVWPEAIGSGIYDFRVELAGPPGARHIAALVHKTSGHRRERAAVEPGKLALDADGRTVPRPTDAGTPAHLPLVPGA
jgi:hypothetical protein